jgi:hypothetical protein
VQEEMAPPDVPEGKVEDQVLLFRNRSEAVLWEKVSGLFAHCPAAA